MRCTPINAAFSGFTVGNVTSSTFVPANVKTWCRTGLLQAVKDSGFPNNMSERKDPNDRAAYTPEPMQVVSAEHTTKYI